MQNRYFKKEQTILHIPHSSTFIPEKYIPLFYIHREHLQKELLQMTDSYTDQLFDVSDIPERNRFVFPYSRLICDVERFRDDRQESMAARGMGVCYTKTSSLKPMKAVTFEHKKEMMKLYDWHHTLLTRAVERIIDRYGEALLIDCHSFASARLPYEDEHSDRDGISSRPDICIGTDPEFHTPGWLSSQMIKAFEDRGYSVSVNVPFGGSLVPMKYYHRDSRLLSVMIEVNRRLYMDEITGEKKLGFVSVREAIEGAIANLAL